MSLFFPGSYQIYIGDVKKGAFFCALVALQWALVVWVGTFRTFGGLLSNLGLSLGTAIAAAVGSYASTRRIRVTSDAGRGRARARLAGAILYCTALIVAQNLMLRVLTIRAFKIPVDSMAPTILRDDRMIVDMNWYRQAKPARGDLVVFSAPNGELLLKRVVGLGGEVIEGRDGKV